MSKDPFQILADELTLIRQDMDKLQRTSLSKADAEALHEIVADAVDDMQRATREAPAALQGALKVDREQMARNASQAAAEAAQGVLGDIREQLAQERLRLSRAAGEARREAWRWFGGFWVWLVSVGALGAVLGLVAAFWLIGRGDAREFGRYPSIYCGSAGGQVVERDDASFCAVWIERPAGTGN